MPQCSRVAIPVVVFTLVCILFLSPPYHLSLSYGNYESNLSSNYGLEETNLPADMASQSGVLNPVSIHHTGTTHGYTQAQSLRTDVDANPHSEILLPAGAPENYYSADCYDGGFFLVGSGGYADFGSSAGTLSWWSKWDRSAPHGRFWGQDNNFESRWSGGSLVLDWGSDNTFFGVKSDWLENHWYFFAIAWDESADFIGFYWGDESTIPQEDASTYAWTGSIAGLHTRNAVMNSEMKTDSVDGHIDDFRYFTIARSIDDIRGDYMQRLSGEEPGLSNYYTFENDLSDSAGAIDLEASGSYSFSHDTFSVPDGWRAEQLSINVMNLRRLYVLNGSLDSGLPGVNEDWPQGTDGTYYASGWLARREAVYFPGRQRATYDASGHIALENEGYYVSASTAYRHYDETRIFWYQNVNNSMLNEQFEFEFNYLYQSGPIGNHFEGIFELRFEIRNGPLVLWNWSQDLVNISQRQTWYSTGIIPVNLTGAPSSFEARLVMEVTTAGPYVEIQETDSDLDGDSTNGMFVTVLADDISFIGATRPSCESVDLSVSTPQTGGVSITGALGTGSALLDYQSWNESAIPIAFSSNSSVSFDISAKVSEMKRYLLSLASPSLGSEGVSYSVEHDASPNITMFTFVGSYPEAEDLGLFVYHPDSWENITIIDPFGDDDSDTINVGAGYFEVPAGAIDSVGWWIIQMQAPNYAREIRTQKFISPGSGWADDTVFRTGDRIRCQVVIGTASDNPPFVMNLESELLLPTNEFWANAFMNNATGYVLTGESFTFGSYNASIGEWMATAFWENDSAIAFGHVHFEVYHGLTMFAHTPNIERNLGESFTAAVYIHDQQTGEPILNGESVVVGNWSAGPAFFSPNLAKGWWEADFNTSEIGVGLWVIAINATIPYYEDVNCTIDIQVMTLTVMTTLGSYYVEISPSSTYEAKFRYMFLDGTGIEDADVFVATWSGPASGIEYNDTVEVPGEPGNYTIEFTGNLGGTYFITVTGLKEDHATAATSFYLIVGAISTDLDVSGDELPNELYYNQTYSCMLFYSDWESNGIEGASINITYNPVASIEWIDNGGGFYQFSIRVPSLGSFAIYARIQQFGYAFADISFIFDVVEVPTSILSYGIVSSYYDTRTHEFAFYYNSTRENGVSGAILTPSVSIRSFYKLTAARNGWYNFTLTPAFGNYSATFWLTKLGYQEQEFSFDLIVVKIPIVLSSLYPLESTYSREASSNLTIRIRPIAADTGEALIGATVDYVIENVDGNGYYSGDSGLFEEASGVYTVNIIVPDPGLYVLRITILKDSYETVRNEIVLSSYANPQTILVYYLGAGFLGALALLGVISVTMLGRRYYHSISTRKNLELLALKGRLEDARNLIGLLIIHRKVGLPVYSRILKGGFEESMLSSFIAAISQFRAEFSWDEPIWAAIPITEVITAVQTEVLICAIITLEGSSVKQKEQLEAFGREVGGFYDHEDDTLRAMFHTPELSESFARTFDPIFEGYFDGALMLRYVGVKKSLPAHLKPVSEAMASLSIDYGVTPEAIVKALIMLGYGEHDAYCLTLEAIDSGYLIAGERKLPTPAPGELFE
ncbi:MAG: hypothetical protein ACFFBM_03615 [Promethearchaeota archaeon]